jgi:hypothetical protein
MSKRILVVEDQIIRDMVAGTDGGARKRTVAIQIAIERADLESAL